jgi:hypothetical protein
VRLSYFHVVVSSVVERQGLAVAPRVVVGAVVASAVGVVAFAGVEAAVVGNKQLGKITKINKFGFIVNQNKTCQT